MNGRMGTQITLAGWIALAALVIGNLAVGFAALQNRDSYHLLLYAFWVEIIVIGAINAPKMLIAAAFGRPVRNTDDLLDAGQRTAIVLLILVFYVVALVVLIFVAYLLLFLVPLGLRSAPGGSLFTLPKRPAVADAGSAWWIVAAVAFGHVVSFFSNFLGRREFRRASVILLALQPFARLALTGLVISVSLVIAMSQPAVASTTLFAVLLIAAKLVADIAAHLYERRRFTLPADRESFAAV